MKSKALSLFLFLFTCGTLLGQELPDDVSQTFKKGDASLIENHLSSKVQYTLLSNQQNLTKEETVKALNLFFSNHPVTDFSILHRSKRENSGFVIGKLTTQKGIYRIHILFKESNNQFSISQIRIDEFNE